MNPKVGAVCVGGSRIDDRGIVISEKVFPETSITLRDLLHLNFIPQPAIFMRRSALERAGGLDTNFRIVFDSELWTRIVSRGGIKCIPEVLATTRGHSETKTLTQRSAIARELKQAIDKALTSSYGSEIQSRERSLIRAKLDYLAASSNLDDFFKHGWAVISDSVRASSYWPPIIPKVLRLFFVKLVVRPVALLRHHWKHKSVEGRKGGRQAIHWSDWEPDLTAYRIDEGHESRH